MNPDWAFVNFHDFGVQKGLEYGRVLNFHTN